MFCLLVGPGGDGPQRHLKGDMAHSSKARLLPTRTLQGWLAQITQSRHLVSSQACSHNAGGLQESGTPLHPSGCTLLGVIKLFALGYFTVCVQSVSAAQDALILLGSGTLAVDWLFVLVGSHSQSLTFKGPVGIPSSFLSFLSSCSLAGSPLPAAHWQSCPAGWGPGMPHSSPFFPLSFLPSGSNA